MNAQPSRVTILSRSLRLRCAVCGRGKLFRGWFRMHEHCDHCGVKFDRAPGYYLGSVYFNYGVTAVLVVTIYFGLYFSGVIRADRQDHQRFLLWTLGLFCLLFPLWFFRYARSLWFGFDHYWDPMDRPDR